MIKLWGKTLLLYLIEEKTTIKQYTQRFERISIVKKVKQKNNSILTETR